ncbi:Uncharacterised protein [Mycobacteroides abscessus subsp. abscessus]|nr:Uncharacterised protein [Mycobacteroides abscessus subsp. abscessus]
MVIGTGAETGLIGGVCESRSTVFDDGPLVKIDESPSKRCLVIIDCGVSPRSSFSCESGLRSSSNSGPKSFFN